MSSPVTASTRPARVTADDLAAQLVATYARLPLADPSRAALREQAIAAWLPMAERLARRYINRGEPIEDLRQTAVIGLLKAVDRFDPERGVDFVGYAVPTILGEIRRYFRDRAWSIRVPRRLQELGMAITAANADLTQTLGRRPTVAEIAAHLGHTEEEIIEGLEGARAYRAVSLSTPVGEDSPTELGDMLGGEDDGFALAELQIALGPALRCLTERERRIVTLRFFGNQTQTQIADQIGVSQMHVSRLLSAALAKLRRQLDPAGC